MIDNNSKNNGENNFLKLPEQIIEGDDYYLNFCGPKKIFLRYSQKLTTYYKSSEFEHFPDENVITIIRENNN